MGLMFCFSCCCLQRVGYSRAEGGQGGKIEVRPLACSLSFCRFLSPRTHSLVPGGVREGGSGTTRPVGPDREKRVKGEEFPGESGS